MATTQPAPQPAAQPTPQPTSEPIPELTSSQLEAIRVKIQRNSVRRFRSAVQDGIEVTVTDRAYPR